MYRNHPCPGVRLLLLRFIVELERQDLHGTVGRFGPLFHRWLPDGEKDAIALDTGDSNARLKIWFERTGFVKDGFIEFDRARREVDPKIMSRQGLLDAGPLHAVLEIRDLEESQLSFLRNNAIGDPDYVGLGKRAAKLVYSSLSRLLDLLRTNYGQYWIGELASWDSRKESVGHYCRSLRAQWSLDDGETWTDFVPDHPMVTLTTVVQFGLQPYRVYLSKEDYQEIPRNVGEDPSPAARRLSRSHESLDQGDLRNALLEGATAAELAVSEFIRRKFPKDYSILGSFSNVPLRVQLAVLAAAAGRSSAEDIEHSEKAIDMRNKVVHEGWNPTDDAEIEVSGLHRTVAVLLSGPDFRFPSIDGGNTLAPESPEAPEGAS